MQSIIRLENGSIAQVNVYRDEIGNVVIVGMARHQTPAGPSETVIQTRMTPAVFEHYRQRAIAELGPMLYTRLLGRAGISDDITRAPMLPATTPRLLGR